MNFLRLIDVESNDFMELNFDHVVRFNKLYKGGSQIWINSGEGKIRFLEVKETPEEISLLLIKK